MSQFDLITILGPTAAGKTKLACHLASEISGEIISADSRQIYRGMDIGTGKDLDEYVLKGLRIKYHLINIKPPGYKYNIEEFQRDFVSAFNTIKTNGNFPILCGGSGLYIETALRGGSFIGIPSDSDQLRNMETWEDEKLETEYLRTEPLIQEQLNALTRQRKMRAIEINSFLKENPSWKPLAIPAINSLLIGIEIDRDLRRQKISDRLSYRMNNGLIEEVETLLKNGLTFDDLAYYGLEYKWVGLYLKDEIGKRELFEGLSTSIHQFAKKQMTWFRRMEKKGYVIHWLPATNPIQMNAQQVLDLMK